MNDKKDHVDHQLQEKIWQQQSRRWRNVSQPTRPGEEDQSIVLQLAEDTFNQISGSTTVTVLGVTPEIVHLPWPEQTKLYAFDQSMDMITEVWEPHRNVDSTVSQSYWQDLPIQNQSVDIAVGDGCLTALQGFDEIHAVLEEMARVLKPSGRLILRCFIRPDNSEPADSVVSDAQSNNIRLFGTLKFRLAMSLCNEGTSTIRPKFIHEQFNTLFPDRHSLSRATGWSLDTINTIDSYENMQGFFTFPLMSELEKAVSSYFSISDLKRGNYEMAERCPTFALTPKGS